MANRAEGRTHHGSARCATGGVGSLRIDGDAALACGRREDRVVSSGSRVILLDHKPGPGSVLRHLAYLRGVAPDEAGSRARD